MPMSPARRLLALAAGSIAVFSATLAEAHAHLTASAPAAKAVVAAPKVVTLTFNEPLEVKFSGLTLTGPAGAAAVNVVASDDRKTLRATPQAPLSAGAYKVNWHAVAKDGHRMEGTFDFTVR